MEPAVGCAFCSSPRRRPARAAGSPRRASECAQRLADGVARDLDRPGLVRLALARAECALERVERGLVVAGLVVLPAEVVEERAEPSTRRASCVSASSIPRLVQSTKPSRSGADERDHVRRVGCDEVLLGREGAARRPTRRADAPLRDRRSSAGAVRARGRCAPWRRRSRPRERLRLVDERVARGRTRRADPRRGRAASAPRRDPSSDRLARRAARGAASRCRRGRRSPTAAGGGRPRSRSLFPSRRLRSRAWSSTSTPLDRRSAERGAAHWRSRVDARCAGEPAETPGARAALQRSVERGRRRGGYALSPRSTRGATRA